jgi:hypothetical protein
MASSADGVPAEPATSAALGKMLDDFDTFEGVLRNGTRQRRERDESRIADLRQIITQVEEEVAQESGRRVEAAKALQGWAETQVLGVRTRLEELLAAAHADTLRRIAALNERVTSLEAKFEEDRLKTLEEVDRRNRELVAALQAFHEEFEAERRSRLERETAILDRLGAAEHEALAQWDRERDAREAVYMEVKKRLEEAVDSRTKIDAKFQAAMLSEISAIKNGITAEETAREAEDDALAKTLNAYVQKLQASLALINGEDVDF